ncbi:hypothetical protein SAMN04488057_106199 [Cyclobacterium lianum]|uniref:Outer membrane protein beta-barrel domain-containing protein n=1 Tax=Cyclobacterium lianum TaxID=388280 RepID=A0A1M7NZR8_9BACT|nr:hypothetical protein [Cyclobacterium lianum]SHN09603.1 hypothetical protein SAMN04488057_106199 [Cyclobacterium lianum]
MKKICFIFLFLCLWNIGQAQIEGQYRFQYGHDFSTGTDYLGVNFVGEYFPVDNVSFAPSFSVYLPKTGKASQIDLTGRYYFTEDDLQAYGLLGYGFYRRRSEFDRQDPLRGASGVHFGGGALYRFLEVLGLNGEVKVQPQYGGRFNVKLGVSYFIN